MHAALRRWRPRTTTRWPTTGLTSTKLVPVGRLGPHLLRPMCAQLFRADRRDVDPGGRACRQSQAPSSSYSCLPSALACIPLLGRRRIVKYTSQEWVSLTLKLGKRKVACRIPKHAAASIRLNELLLEEDGAPGEGHGLCIAEHACALHGRGSARTTCMTALIGMAEVWVMLDRPL